MKNNIILMKTCGLLGGIAWTSSSHYYKMMNIGVSNKLGGLYSSKSLMFSLNLQEYSDLAYIEDKTLLKELIAEAAVAIFRAGADFLVICSNTAHMAIDEIEMKCKENKLEKFISKDISILHITDCTAFVIKKQYPQIKRIGLIGTIFTMKSKHVVNRLERHGFEVVVPRKEEDQRSIMDIIENELTKEIFDNPNSIKTIINIIYELKKEENIQGVVLGCTELPLLIKERKLKDDIYVFDATEMHIECAIKVQLNDLKIEDFLP